MTGVNCHPVIAVCFFTSQYDVRNADGWIGQRRGLG